MDGSTCATICRCDFKVLNKNSDQRDQHKEKCLKKRMEKKSNTVCICFSTSQALWLVSARVQ